MSTFGNTSPSAGTAADWANYKGGVTYALGEAGSVSKLSLYCNNTGSGHAACKIKGLIYADSFGALLATSSEVDISDSQADGWVDLPFGSPIGLAAGNYVLTFHGNADATGLVIHRSSSADIGRYNTDTYSDGPSDPFGAGSSWNVDLAIYATYTPSGIALPLLNHLLLGD